MAEYRLPEHGAGDKRCRGSPTGDTPLQQGKKQQRDAAGHWSSSTKNLRRRKLPFSDSAWSDFEQSALVEFLLLLRPGERWPADQDEKFWKAAAEFIAMRSETDIQRTGIFNQCYHFFRVA